MQQISKTINLLQNLTRSHLQVTNAIYAKPEIDWVVFLLLRQLFLENVLTLGGIREAILANQIKCIDDF